MSHQLKPYIEHKTEADVHELYSIRSGLTASKATGGIHFGRLEYIYLCYYFVDRVLAP